MEKSCIDLKICQWRETEFYLKKEPARTYITAICPVLNHAKTLSNSWTTKHIQSSGYSKIKSERDPPPVVSCSDTHFGTSESLF